MEYLDMIFGYCVIAFVVGLFAYHEMHGYTPKKRFRGALIIGIWWPVVILIIIALLLEDLVKYAMYKIKNLL